jgi:hypothetical protein
MATKKRKKKVTKAAKTAAKKGRPAARPKKAAARRPKKTAARKSTARKSTARKSPARKAPAPKVPARKAPKKPPEKKSPARVSGTHAKAVTAVRREDRAGHLDAHYAAQLREQSGPREHEPRAFIETPRSPRDDLAEELGEEVVERATTGGEDVDEALDPVVPEERGGPFVETNAAQEFAEGTDESNPPGAKREPFPTT